MRGFSAIALIGPKTEPNVGGAMRAAQCFGASLIILEGMRFKRFSTDTMAAWKHIPLLAVDDLYSAVPHDCTPIAIELVDGAKPLTTFPHPQRALYIFGPEDGNVPNRILRRVRDVVQIPSALCLNLAACVNVVLYDRMMKRAAVGVEE